MPLQLVAWGKLDSLEMALSTRLKLTSLDLQLSLFTSLLSYLNNICCSTAPAYYYLNQIYLDQG